MREKSAIEENITPPIVCQAPWRLVSVKVVGDYRLHVEFIDGTEGLVDMSVLIHSSHAGVFAVLRDVNVFNQVFLEYGVVTWPGELDLAPDAMHTEIKKNGCWVLR